MTSCKKFFLVCTFLLSLLAVASILYLRSDIDNSEYIMRQIYLNKEVTYTTGGIMSGDILVNQTRNQENHNRDDDEYINLANQTSWFDYSNNWSGDILVRKLPQNNLLNFTDEYRYAMASKGLHPLNIEHKYLYERYLTMNKYCNSPLTKIDDLYDVMGSFYRVRLSDTFKLLQCALLKVASSTWFFDILRPLEGLKEEKYPFPTLWHKLALKFGINNPELTAMRYQTYTKFLIVRHPFSRLFSAYKDKFVVAFQYGDRMADKIIRQNYLSNMTQTSIVQMRQELKRGGNELTSGLSDNIVKQLRRLDSKAGNFKITFLEFLNFLISKKGPNGFTVGDDHFDPVYIVCNPCAIRYDIIAKFETLLNDSNLILNYVKTHHDHNVSFPKSNSITSSDSCNKAFKDLPLTVRRSLYEMFKEDFLIFGYEYREEGDNFC